MRLCLTLLVLLVGGPSAAWAQRKAVVLLPLGGPRASEATRSVMRMLASRYKLVAPGRFFAAARAQSLNPALDPGRIAAAKALKVSAIVSGSLGQFVGRWTLRLRVASGHSARPVGSIAFPLRGLRLDPVTTQRAAGWLARVIASTRVPVGAAIAVRIRRPTRGVGIKPGPRRGVRVAAAAPVPQAPVATPAPIAKPAPPRRAPTPTRPKTRPKEFDDGSDVDRSDDDDEQPTTVPPRRVGTARVPENAGTGSGDLGFEVSDDDTKPKRVARYTETRRRARRGSGEEGNDDPPPERKGSARRRPSWESIFEVSAGMVLLNRSFTFNDPVKPKDPAPYKTPAVVPAINLEGALYPIAAFHRGPFANLGIVARYYRVVSLKSRVSGGAGGSLPEVGTLVQQFEIGLRYRWNILRRATSPTLRAGLDYGRLMFFILEEDQNVPQQIFPDVSYTYLKLALLGFDWPFYKSGRFSFGVNLSFDYLLVFSSGDIERNETGGYGKSSTGGIDVGGGLGLSYAGFFAKASGFYRRMFYSFDGSCFRSNNSCNYAGGALDIYAGVNVNIGYAY